MNEAHNAKTHWGFWVICLVGLLWNAGGAANYLMQTNPEFVSSMPASHQAIIVDRPAWATAGFAIGVFGGALGCILLMLKIRAALPVFALSLIGIVLAAVHTLNLARTGVAFTAVELIVMVLLPLLVAAALLVYARRVLSNR